MIDILFVHGLPVLDEVRIADWLAELPDEYRQRLSRLRIRKRLVQSLIGLQLLTLLASQRGATDFRLVTLRTTALGKPHSDELGDFSISHDEDLVACAMTGRGRVGLDVERIRDINIGHFARVFNPSERAWIGDDRQRFFDLWTRKEAAVKVSGEHGIGHLRAVNIDGEHTELDEIALQLKPLHLAPGYTACVASDSGIGEVRVQQVVLTPLGWQHADLAAATRTPREIGG